jgi:hypothetical protein
MRARVIVPLLLAFASGVTVARLSGGIDDARSWAAYLGTVGVVTALGLVIRFGGKPSSGRP